VKAKNQLNEDSPQQAAGYQKEMHSDEKPRFLKLFPLSGNPIASYGESARLTYWTFKKAFLPKMAQNPNWRRY
jgi:hypothetical protein